ncbi:MAG: DUF5678 domain-containing protein [Candidatus Paceibacterota bacterium]|jgi:hypothetical protein
MSNKIDKLSNNFSKITKSFKGKWVASSEDYSKVIASANTLNEVIKKIGKDQNPKIFKVVPLDMVYSPFS